MIIEVREDTMVYRVHTKGFDFGLKLCVLPFKIYGYCLKLWCFLLRKNTIEMKIDFNIAEVV